MTLLENWIAGKARTSNYTGLVYLTKKERRMADREFLKPSGPRLRMYKGARRAKPIPK